MLRVTMAAALPATASSTRWLSASSGRLGRQAKNTSTQRQRLIRASNTASRSCGWYHKGVLPQGFAGQDVFVFSEQCRAHQGLVGAAQARAQDASRSTPTAKQRTDQHVRVDDQLNHGGMIARVLSKRPAASRRPDERPHNPCPQRGAAFIACTMSTVSTLTRATRASKSDD